MEWFEHWFNNDYLRVYSHRDELQAASQADFVLKACRLRPDDDLLDIACGNGRHLRFLQSGLRRAVGIDLSPDLLVAARTKGARLLARADMRQLPFANQAFSAITCFFTGFGYFNTDAEHLSLLQEWRRVLRVGGSVFLDYMNRDHVLRSLIPRSVRSDQDMQIEETRSLSTDGRRIEKTISLTQVGTTPRQYSESVALYSPPELERLFHTAGFRVHEKLGDFAGAALGPDSERLIFIARPDDT